MRSQFDGLRTILGNSGVAVPLVDAPAVEEPSAIAKVSDASPDTDHPFADIPGLADLDQGLYKGDAKDASLSVDDDLFASVNARVSQQPTGTRRNHPEPSRAPEAERRVSGWAAAAVMAVGLFLGGSAALAIFYDNVEHILASLR
jgi:hypothetical protein